MDQTTLPVDELRKAAVEKFWESFPPFWQEVRLHIRQVAAESFSLSFEQFHLLRHIHRGLNSNSELAAALHISRPGASQAIDALVSKGLIQRNPDAKDRRYVRLELTPSGVALIEAVFNENRQWMMKRWSLLSAAELTTLLQALETLRKA